MYSDREENFNDCFRNKIVKLLEDKLVCQSAAIHGLNLSSKVPVCLDNPTSYNATKIALKNFLNGMQNLDEFGCSLPCSYSKYSFDMVRQHKNAFLLVDGSNETKDYLLYVYYSSLESVLESESLRIDFSNLMSGIGGALGLFLGISCLTIYLFILEFFKNMVN